MTTVYCVSSSEHDGFHDNSLDLNLIDRFFRTTKEAMDYIRKQKTCPIIRRGKTTTRMNWYAVED